ncbi:MAG: caspase family protein [Chloracidobacterium sp.]|nr:caspase family protein [Chloracidobacterium sp.]MDW8216061.1 caspase family protein [Acidobacteriota bacterium]
MVEAVKRFRQRLRESGGVGLFYFAGHGVEVGGVNYLIPVEADPREELDVKYQGVDVGDVLEAMKESRLGIVILDACRDNPFRGAWAGKRTSGGWGLGRTEAPSGMLIAYATGPGKTARDGYQGERNGLYTEVLLEVMRRPGLKVEEVFKAVRVEVERRSGGEQVPWEPSSLKGDFYFRPVAGDVQGTDAKTPVSGGKPAIELKVEREVPRGVVAVRVWEIGMAVEVDGKALGVAEAKGEVFRVKELAAGRVVTVVGRKAGMAVAEKRVEVEAGKEVELGLPSVGEGVCRRLGAWG